MSTQEITKLNEVSSIVMGALLLLATVVQSATHTEGPQTTLSPAVSPTMQTTQHLNVSMEEPLVLRLYKPCGEELKNYCENGGQCMYPQDNKEHYCICKPGYSGLRCSFNVGDTYKHPHNEELIGMGVGVAVLIFILAIVLFCCFHRRCKKSSQLIKAHGSENSV